MMANSRVGGKVYRYPKVIVNMTDKDVIDHVVAMFGGSTYAMPPARKFPDRKPQWRAQISGWQAADWMRRLYPCLGTRRRARIDEILAEYEAQEPTQVRRSRSCSEAAAKRPRRADGTFGRSS
jgi:hypothetical protein